jgi:hypothetical protein
MDYYLEIHTRAVASYTGTPVSAENYDETWVPHWFKTAEELRNEFSDQGLSVTAIHVQSLMDEQRKFYK